LKKAAPLTLSWLPFKMADASEKVTAEEEKSPKSTSVPSKLEDPSGLDVPEGKHRGNLANLTMTNYSAMLSKEKDQYIEKLRRRNLIAKKKIQELENANADFWKTIQQQQDLLETFEKKLEEQETQFKKEMHFLRNRKNEDIRKLKSLLAKERGEKVKVEHQSPVKVSASEKNELESLRTENTRLENEVQRLTNLVDLTAWKGYAELPMGDEEDIRKQLEDKEEELQAVRQELIIAKSVPASPVIGTLDGRNELDSELDKINLLKESEVTKNFLSKEMEKSAQAQDELSSMDIKVQELKRENLQLVELLQEKEATFDQQLHEALEEREKRMEELEIREDVLRRERKSMEEELSAAKKKAETKSKEAQEFAQACESLTKELEEYRLKGSEALSNQQDLKEETESEKMKAFRREHQHAHDKLLKEVATLKQEREWIRDSKMSTISSLSSELERLRRHVALALVV